jgi:hypothetical protein
MFENYAVKLAFLLGEVFHPTHYYWDCVMYVFGYVTELFLVVLRFWRRSLKISVFSNVMPRNQMEVPIFRRNVLPPFSVYKCKKPSLKMDGWLNIK